MAYLAVRRQRDRRAARKASNISLAIRTLSAEHEHSSNSQLSSTAQDSNVDSQLRTSNTSRAPSSNPTQQVLKTKCSPLYFISGIFIVASLVILVPALISSKSSYLIAFGSLFGIGMLILLVTCCLTDVCCKSSSDDQKDDTIAMDVEKQSQASLKSNQEPKPAINKPQLAAGVLIDENERSETPSTLVIREYHNLPSVST